MDKHARKVLVVEDSLIINKLLTHSIADQLHLDVESAKSMQEAQALLEKYPEEFLISVVDLNLPDAANGEIVDTVLRAGVPPIILTGSMSDDLHDEMMEKPIVDYVIKRNLNEIEYVIQTIKRISENHTRKVLVVDDSKSSRILITSLLRRHKLQILEAEDGQAALRILERHKDISLLITDYNMPEMDGMELTTKVREKYSRTQLAILGISATGTGIISTRFLKSGANDFIARPFMHEEFYCRVNQNLDVISCYQQLEESANHDFLTGLYNRKYLFTTGEKLLQNAKRNNLTLCAAMIDIDHFKKINDNYGHHIGDEVLKHISNILNQQMRESDILARIGGEEFCLLCINLNPENANKLFDRFLNAVKEAVLQIESLSISITISIGYTTTLRDSLEGMLVHADKALYNAKENGRNQVVCAMPENTLTTNFLTQTNTINANNTH